MSVILICGLNGSGKTTLGKELANALGFTFLNDEDYYFLESEIPYSKSRTEDDARAFVISFLQHNKDCVIVSSRGDLGEQITSMYDFVIYMSAPAQTRIKRIQMRDFMKFGERVLAGGDMFERQKKFYEFAASRTSDNLEKWLNTLSCKVIRLDGTKEISENVSLILNYRHNQDYFN